MIKILQIPMGGYRKRKVSGHLTPGSELWVKKPAPLPVAKWASKDEFLKYQAASRPDLLDKLADHSQAARGATIEAQKQTEQLRKRAKAKFFTNGYIHHLIDLESPLKKAYTNTLYCATELKEENGKITTRYCKNRWCHVCNRIRTAKGINGYMPELSTFTDPKFVTLTLPNVKKEQLRETMRAMVHTWIAMYKKMHRHCRINKIRLAGLRKVECTFNPVEDTYHPHFHFIVEGNDIAEMITSEWLTRIPTASPLAQKITPADAGSMKELFKYFTKMITKGSIFIAAMDVIYQSMKGFKIYQPFGIKVVNVEPDDLEAITLEDRPELLTWWKWKHHDWYNAATGEWLTGFSDITNMQNLFKNIIL